MHNSIGRVVEVSTGYIKFEIDNLKILNYNYKGYSYRSQGINEYVYIAGQSGEEYIYQTVKAEDKEKIFSDSENSKIDHSGIITCIPIGSIKNNGITFNLNRYPFLNDDVYLATINQLNIIYSTSPENKSMQIGETSDGFIPNIDIERYLTRHTAILGNTGSGKSTTAKKIISSIRNKKPKNLILHILDVHDEYILKDSEEARHINVLEEFKIQINNLDLQDWVNLLKPSELVQLPIVQMALKISDAINKSSDFQNWLKIYCAFTLYTKVQNDVVGKRTKIISLLHGTGIDYAKYTQYGNFSPEDEKKFLDSLENNLKIKYADSLNTPGKFDLFFIKKIKEADYKADSFASLLSALDFAFILEESRGNTAARSHSSSLETRLKTITERYSKFLVPKSDKAEVTYNEKTLVYSVSDMDDELLLFFSSYLLKNIFESSRENPRKNQIDVFFFEEAHRYISKANESSSPYQVEIFKKISREGRKFGCFIHLSSQRPSEISGTVLSQCNNFILHRIKNNIDLEYMGASIPYISRFQLERVSYLPTGSALLVGDLFPIPLEIDIFNTEEYDNTSSPALIWQ